VYWGGFLIALMTEAVNPSETSENFTKQRNATSYKTVTFILTAVET
jgi:hypothetical protein